MDLNIEIYLLVIQMYEAIVGLDTNLSVVVGGVHAITIHSSNARSIDFWIDDYYNQITNQWRNVTHKHNA